MFIKMRVQEYFENGIGVCPAVSIGANDPFHLEFPTRLLIILTHALFLMRADRLYYYSQFQEEEEKKNKGHREIVMDD